MPRSVMLRNAIRRALIRQKLTLTQLAQTSGINRTTLSRYLNGKAELKSDNLDKVLVVLQIDLAHLLEQKEKRATLAQAFETLNPLQKKTLLKNLAQSVRYGSVPSPLKETLAKDLDHWRWHMNLMERA